MKLKSNLVRCVFLRCRRTNSVRRYLCLLFFVLLFSLLDVSVLCAQQGRKVNGKVTDVSGALLPGVSVVEKGTTHGTVTNIDGEYTLFDIADDATLVFSFVGMKTQEVFVAGKTVVDVRMIEETIGIDEVVALGYSSQKKTSLTASVGVLQGDEEISKPVANVSNLLSGRVSGIIAAQNSGQPGADQSEIHIRGVATTGNSSPLILVDGVPRDFNSLDPTIIKSITVLKDAAAVAPYGMSGANGVILVTTKNGEKGEPKLSYNAYTGFQNPTTIPDYLNSYDYAVMMNEATRNSDPNAVLPFSEEQIEGYRKSVAKEPGADYDLYPNTDVAEELLNKNNLITKHSLSLSGGTDKINYFMGLGYLYQEGMWSTSNLNRYSLSISLEAKATKTTTVKLSLNGSNDVLHNPATDASSIMSYIPLYKPTNAYRYSNGYLGHTNLKNPELFIHNGDVKNENTRLFTQFSIDQELSFIKGLNIKGVFSYDPTSRYIKRWQEPPVNETIYELDTSTDPPTYVAIEPWAKNSLTESQYYYKKYTFQGILSYENSFGKHSVSALAVMDAMKIKNNSFYAGRTEYDLDIHELNMGNSNKDYWNNGGTSSKATQVGYVYKITYGYDGKYLFESAGRYDGNYYFAPGEKYGFFPSFSLGWRLSEENFIKERVPVISNLKLRGSWGQSGNLAGSPFQYSSAMTVYGNAYAIDGNLYQGAYERVEPNPDITWEKSTKYNVGVDFGLWNQKLNVEFDYFYEKRNNMLVSPASVVPIEYGISLAQENNGRMSNRGFDFLIKTQHQFTNNLKLDGGFNLSFAKNKIIEMYENPVTLNDPNRSRTGRPLNTPFGLKSLGLFQESDFNEDGSLKDGMPIPQFGDVAPGDIIWADINEDGIVDDSDEIALGYPVLPQIIYGFELGGSYKNFDLRAFFQGAAQSTSFLEGGFAFTFISGENAPTVAKDYWTPENTNATYPRLYGEGGTSNNYLRGRNDFFKRSGSYMRLKNVELGYSIPDGVCERISIQSIRLYVSGQNLLTFSELKDFYDPEMTETGGAGDTNTRGWYYPHQKVVSLGLNVIF